MNEQKIKDAIDILNTALNDSIADEAPVAVNLVLTKQEVEVLRAICGTNVSVPRVVADCYKTTTTQEVYRMLDKLHAATYRTK